MMTEETKKIFFQFLDEELPINDFEQWIYKHSDNLKTELQADLHFDLISFDYNQKNYLSFLTDKITPYIDIEELNIWRTKKLLTDIIENNIDLVLATRKLHILYYDTGENFIPATLGIGYDSELDDVPTPMEYNQWDEKALKEKLEKVDFYKDKIIRDAKLFLDTLNKL
jgi:hypothetical protein